MQPRSEGICAFIVEGCRYTRAVAFCRLRPYGTVAYLYMTAHTNGVRQTGSPLTMIIWAGRRSAEETGAHQTKSLASVRLLYLKTGVQSWQPGRGVSQHRRETCVFRWCPTCIWKC
jgi:hypothetical protein